MLLSRDESQALRMRRYLMAAGTSLLFCFTLVLLALFERLPWRVAIDGTVSVLALSSSFSAPGRTCAFPIPA
jgi:hypothetical protein